MKPTLKILAGAALLIFSLNFSAGTAQAQSISQPNTYGCASAVDAKGTIINYCPLAPIPIPNNSGVYDVTKGVYVFQGFAAYLANFIKLFMGIVGVLAVLMIIIGGIEYMSTVSIDEKGGAKTRITNAILGLILALSSYVILFTINPSLTEFDIHLPGVVIQLPKENETGTMPKGLPPPSPRGTLPTGTTTESATRILTNKNVKLYSGFGTAKSNAKQNMLDASNGLPSYTDVGGKAYLDPKLVNGIEYIASMYPIQINCITGCDHAEGSGHYSGKAIDIQSYGNTANDKAIEQACYDAGATKLILGPSGTGFATNAEHQTHIHCEWP